VYPPKVTRSANLQDSQYEWLAFLRLLEIIHSQTTAPIKKLKWPFSSHRGRLAFVWRQALIAGWLATVGERSVLVIRPYLFMLNQLSSLSDTMGSQIF
jgi:hypothetical protein